MNIEEVKKFLQEDTEGQQYMQKEIDRAVTKGIETFKTKREDDFKKELEERVEEEIKKRNPQKTPLELELEQLKNEIENSRKEARKKEVEAFTTKELSKRGLSLELASSFIKENEEQTLEKIVEFETIFKNSLEVAVEERFKKAGRVPSAYKGQTIKNKNNLSDYLKDKNK